MRKPSNIPPLPRWERARVRVKTPVAPFKTPNIDYNGRFRMSSAAAAGIKAFGIDRGLPFPVDDIAKADTQSRHPKQTK